MIRAVKKFGQASFWRSWWRLPFFRFSSSTRIGGKTRADNITTNNNESSYSMKLTTRWKAVGMGLACAFLLIPSCLKVLADCNTYASNREDAPLNSCSSANNTSTGNSSCTYEFSTVPIFCRATTADTECYSPAINSLTGQPTYYQCIVWTQTGWCVDGVCNYNVSIGGSNPQSYSHERGTGDRPCPQG
jgi:hypothetical protein